jgi:2-phospho-L-lactate guanylyltransferase
MRWTVVIPAKALPAAKSRLVPASVDAAAHRRLVGAIRADTIGAARDADGVARVLVVTDRAGTVDDAAVTELVQARPGLNGALADAARHAARAWPDDGVAALVGDLPALRPAELAAALAGAAAHARAFVPDADGTGTTLLSALPGTDLDPRFGPGSAARHAQHAATQPGGPGLRADVDTAADLARALRLGPGPRTAAVVAAADTVSGDTVHLDVG